MAALECCVFKCVKRAVHRPKRAMADAVGGAKASNRTLVQSERRVSERFVQIGTLNVAAARGMRTDCNRAREREPIYDAIVVHPGANRRSRGRGGLAPPDRHAPGCAGCRRA